MTLTALQHLLRAAQALAEDRTFLVFGSAALLVRHPDLGLDEALGENRAYFRRHGYHADVLRDSILSTLPRGWRERLLSIPTTAALALDECDVAAVKLWVGPAKDLALVRFLVQSGTIDPGTLRRRIEELPISIEKLPRVLANLKLTEGGF
jgi:hypothetical protein